MESYRKNKWTNKNANFFTGFHHLAYLESIKSSYGKNKPIKQNLPKLPYLHKKSNTRFRPYFDLKNRRHYENTAKNDKECESLSGQTEPASKEPDITSERNAKTELPDEIEENTVVERDDKSDTQESNFKKVLRELENAQIQLENEIFRGDSKQNTAAQSQPEDVTSRLLDSMKALIIKEKADSSKGSVTWDDVKSESDMSATAARFPRETRTAMMVLLNRSKGQRKPTNKYSVKQVETQTTPGLSTTEFYHRLPCVKNLLCTKGFHSGKCDGDSETLSVCTSFDNIVST